MRSNKDLTNHEFIASQNIKRAMVNLYDGDYNGVEECLGKALEMMYKVNTPYKDFGEIYSHS